ncbi:MAG TPA: hypothetical protein DEF42_07090 [Desulfosporosinus sp.]|nr:hypothetical protein [Desulfosporosinus sp.]
MQDTEKMYRRIVETAQEGIWITDSNHLTTYVNNKIVEMLSYEKEEILGQPFTVFLANEFSELAMKSRTQRNSSSRQADAKFICKNGTEIWAIVSYTHFYNEHDEYTGSLAMVTDITEREQIEVRLRESEEKYRQLFDLVADSIFLIDNESGKIVEVNEAAASLYGYTREELLSLKNTDLSAEPDKTRMATNKGLTTVPLRWHRKKNGTVFPVDITAKHFSWHGNGVHIAAIRDITQRQEAEKALIESEQRYRDIFEYSSDCIFLIDVIEGNKFKYTKFNPAEEKSVGLKTEQVAGKLVEEVFNQELAHVLNNNYRNCCEKGVPIKYEERLEMPSGFVYFHTSLIPIRDTMGQVARIVGIASDITELKFQSQALQERNEFLQKMADTVPLPIYFKDVKGRYIGCNASFEAFTGTTREEIIPKSAYDLHLKNADFYTEKDFELFNNPGVQVFESTVELNGRINDAIFHKATYLNSNGSVSGLVGVIVDVTEQKKMEKSMQHRIALEGAIAQASSLFVSPTGADADVNEVLKLLGEIVAVNRAYIFKLREKGSKMDNVYEWCSAGTEPQIDNLQDLDSSIFPWWMSTLKSGKNVEIANIETLPESASAEKEILQAQGIISLLVVPIQSMDDNLIGFMGFDDTEKPREWLSEDNKVLRVVAEMVGVYWERERTEAELQLHATHDFLTKIPNRYYFEEILNRAEAKAKRGGKSALLLIDVDNLKLVNDSHGHKAGDEILIDLVKVLKRNLRESDFLARLGGDEFAVLLEVNSEKEAGTIAERLRQGVYDSELNLITHGFRLNLSISIGIIMVDGTLDYQRCLALADTALYAAKEAGRNRIAFAETTDDFISNLTEANNLLSLIKSALREDKFVLHFQPVLRISDGETIHYEALIRLRDQDGDMISPGKFIPIAERFGLMPQIDHWVVRTTLAKLREFPELKIFVNLSGMTLGDESTLGEIEESIRESGIEPSQIGFEITETAAVKDLLRAVRWIEKLKKLGCLFALDDFGTGFSSFSYLRTLPVDYIKIDGSFVSNADTEPVNRAMIQAIYTIAKTLKIKTVAEFVENENILKVLQNIGIDCGQGFYLGRPNANVKMISMKSIELEG